MIKDILYTLCVIKDILDTLCVITDTLDTLCVIKDTLDTLQCDKRYEGDVCSLSPLCFLSLVYLNTGEGGSIAPPPPKKSLYLFFLSAKLEKKQ